MRRSAGATRRSRLVRPRLFAFGLALGIAVAAALVLFRGRIGRESRVRPWNVLFITVDTLRADRLGAYGYAGARTPNMDRLAREGVLFEACISPTPLTLPSHTSLFSGTYPLHHGVRDNGSFLVPPTLPTLATLLSDRGYRTAAIVAAFVLDSRWGLNRGFSEYVDDFDTHRTGITSIGDIQRPGNEVADRALAWLERRPKGPFFLWAHFYDPHDPYEPPSPYREEFADRPYDGEVAFADAQIGRLLERVERREREEPLLVVLAGDHGESLGEHEESGHGLFLYETTLRVPLIFRLPDRERAGTRRAETVSLVDVLPTVAELLRFPAPAGLQGQSLVGLLRGSGGFTERPAYAETYYPRLHFGWSELHALRDRRWKWIDSPEPELYDLAADPGERRNLVDSASDRALPLRRRLASWSQEWSRGALPVAMSRADPETLRKLASLGYLTGAAPEPGGASALPAPRRRIGLYNDLLRARSLVEQRDFSGGERLLRAILAADPQIVDAETALGSLYLQQKRFVEAMQVLAGAVEHKPSDPTVALGLAVAELAAGRPAAAERTIETALSLFPNDSRFFLLLGQAADARGDRARAEELETRVLKLEPRSAQARAALSEIRLRRGDLEAARRLADEALALDRRTRGAHYCRAVVLEQQGRPDAAWEEYALEVQVAPNDGRPFRELMILSRRLGRLSPEAEILKEVQRLHPEAPLPALYLARNLLDRGIELSEGIRLAKLSLEMRPDPAEAALACYVLADLYSRTGEPSLSRDFAARGRKLERSLGASASAAR